MALLDIFRFRTVTAPPTALETLTSDFGAWGLSEVDQALPSLFSREVGGASGYTSNRAYLDGDHFQDAAPWKGPGWTAAGTMAQRDKEAIARTLTPVPEIEDCTSYRTDGVCGIEAEPSVAPTEPAGPADEKGKPTFSQAQEQLREEWKREVGAWWRRVGYWRHVRETFKEASGAGQACVRLVINRQFTEQDGNGGRRTVQRQPDRAAALLRIECTSPRANVCGVYTHPDTFQRVGLWRGKTEDGKEDLAELWFERDGQTVWRQLRGERVTEKAFPWGGLLPIVPLQVEPILTTPVRNLQAALDTESTGLLRNAVMHGYTQRNKFDTMPPGEWLTVAPVGQATLFTKVVDGVTFFYHESGTEELGPSVTYLGYGIETLKKGNPADGTAEYEYQSPRVEYHTPSPPDNIIKTADWYVQRIREACRQGHRVGGSTAEASGDAYEQKRARYEADLRNCGGEVATLTERTMTVLTVMADWLAGADDPVFLSDWTVSATVHTDAGPVSSGKMQELANLGDKGLLSVPTIQQRMGVRDVEDEMERIREQDTLGATLKRAEAAAKLIEAGADRMAAWMEVGYSEERARELARTDGGFVTEP